MDVKPAQGYVRSSHEETSTPTTTKASTTITMTSTIDIICYIPWICTILVTWPAIRTVADSLGEADTNALFLSFFCVTFASFSLFKTLKKYVAGHIERTCARLKSHNYPIKDFCSGVGNIIYILMQYGCVMLTVPLCMIIMDCNPDRIFAHCVLAALLMIILQGQIENRAVVVRFTLVFMLFVALACYIVASAWLLPEATKYGAKWL